ncbi:MAG TPA: hypothetical protein VFH36_09435 [Acidimicrobiales bacterium]|nr:hypothetical protein [Acidimicrobiales bacterium]
MPGQLDDQPGPVPAQVDAGGAAARLAPLDLHSRERQPRSGNDADRLLFQPAVTQWAALRAVEERREGWQSRSAAAAQGIETPPEVRTPDEVATFGVVEHGLQLGRLEP